MKKLLEIAEKLDGIEYGANITERVELPPGVVVAYGHSDDLVEFYGAIDDEIGAFGGAKILFDHGQNILTNDCSDNHCPFFEREQVLAREAGRVLTAKWGDHPGGWAWVIKVSWPKACFEISEDGEPFSQGIVFYKSDIGKK